MLNFVWCFLSLLDLVRWPLFLVSVLVLQVRSTTFFFFFFCDLYKSCLGKSCNANGQCEHFHDWSDEWMKASANEIFASRHERKRK